MKATRVAEMTVDELKHLAREVTQQTVVEFLSDPDEGFELCGEMKTKLRASLAGPRPCRSLAWRLGWAWNGETCPASPTRRARKSSRRPRPSCLFPPVPSEKKPYPSPEPEVSEVAEVKEPAPRRHSRRQPAARRKNRRRPRPSCPSRPSRRRKSRTRRRSRKSRRSPRSKRPTASHLPLMPPSPSASLAWLRDHSGWHARADILAALDDLSAGKWNSAIRELVEFGEVEKKGQKRGTRYRASLKAGESGQ